MDQQYSTNAHYTRTLIAFVISVFLYFTTINIVGSNLDLYGAVIYYINWIENISLVDWGNNVFVETYYITNTDIAAPEPMPGLLAFLITRFVNSPEHVLDVINIGVIFLYVNLCSKYIANKYLFLLLCVTLFTGYYEYVLLHMTHRFKIAILFFLVSMSLAESYRKLSSLFYMLALFSHLSMSFVIPILFCFQKMNFRNVPALSYKYFLVIFFSLFVLYNISDEHLKSDYFQQVFGKKISLLNLQDLFFDNIHYIPLFLVGSYIVYSLAIKLSKNFSSTQIFTPKVWLVILTLYFLSSLAIIGTSRLFMVYYICILFIIVVNWQQLSLRPRNAVLLSFVPIFLYSFMNGLLKGPISLISEALYLHLY